MTKRRIWWALLALSLASPLACEKNVAVNADDGTTLESRCDAGAQTLCSCGSLLDVSLCGEVGFAAISDLCRRNVFSDAGTDYRTLVLCYGAKAPNPDLDSCVSAKECNSALGDGLAGAGGTGGGGPGGSSSGGGAGGQPANGGQPTNGGVGGEPTNGGVGGEPANGGTTANGGVGGEPANGGTTLGGGTTASGGVPNSGGVGGGPTGGTTGSGGSGGTGLPPPGGTGGSAPPPPPSGPAGP